MDLKLILKNNKKGFSLVELLAVIVILGIIAGISIGSYNYVKYLVLEEEYNSLISLIETKAESYASNYYVTSVNVQNLIDNGYLDSEDGYIYSPVDNEVLNCYVIDTTQTNGIYTANFSVNAGDTNGVCNMYSYNEDFGIDVVDANGEDISLQNMYTNSGTIWYKENVCLTVSVSTDEKYNNITSVSQTWGNQIGGGTDDENYCISVGTEHYIADVSLLYVYKLGEESNEYVASVYKTIRIDTKAPDLSVTIENEEVYSFSKNVTIEAYDLNGTGLNTIKASFNDNNNDSSIDIDIINDSFTISENGIYKIEACDNIGNCSVETIEMEFIDNTPPEFDVSGNPDEWTGSATLEIIDSSDDVALAENSFAIVKGDSCDDAVYSDNSKLTVNENGTYTACVIDKAGNISYELIEVSFIDSYEPVITYEIITGASLEVAVNISDDESGIKQYWISQNSSNSSYTSGNSSKTLNISYAVSEIGTYYIYAEDTAGNVTKTSFEITSEYLDSVGPIVTNLSILTEGPVNTSIDIGFTLTDSSNVVAYMVSTSSTKPTASSSSWTTVSATSSITITYSKISAVGTYYVYAMDSLGNISDGDAIKVTVSNIDKTAPVVTTELVGIGSYSCNPASGASIYFTISVTDDNSYSISYLLTYSSTNEFQTPSATSSSWSSSSSYAGNSLGSYAVYFYTALWYKVTDAAGNYTIGAIGGTHKYCTYS